MDCKNARLLLEFSRPQSTDLLPPDNETLENHLAECAECGPLARQERRADETLGRAMRNVPVPSDFRDRLLRRLSAERDAWYRQRLVRILGVAAAAAVIILIAGGTLWWWKQSPRELDLAELVHREQGTDSPQKVEQWFKEKKGMHITAPSEKEVNYHYLTYYDLADLGGKKVPRLVFSSIRPPHDYLAFVWIVTTKDFSNLDELIDEETRGSGGYKIRVVPSRDQGGVYYVQKYTDGAENLFFGRRGGNAIQ
jgi:hypothetical protein